MASRTLSHEEARAFYDRFGRKQDLQRVYEDPALDVLLGHADFESAGSVIELGCGTGRLAARLLERHLPAEATYLGLDVSRTMVELAEERVTPWADRAEIRQTDGSLALPVADGAFDRFLSTYVLDLLGDQDIDAVLREARRVLAPGGRLCLASLTFGQTWPSRLISRLWSRVHSLRPQLVGGCRPLDLAARVAPGWEIVCHEVACKLGICTEVVVAT